LQFDAAGMLDRTVISAITLTPLPLDFEALTFKQKPARKCFERVTFSMNEAVRSDGLGAAPN
jgi:hypothetical protein